MPVLLFIKGHALGFLLQSKQPGLSTSLKSPQLGGQQPSSVYSDMLAGHKSRTKVRILKDNLSLQEYSLLFKLCSIVKSSVLQMTGENASKWSPLILVSPGLCIHLQNSLSCTFHPINFICVHKVHTQILSLLEKTVKAISQHKKVI